MQKKNPRTQNLFKMLIQFVKFNFVGLMNTALDYLVFMGLGALGVNDYFAQIFSYTIGIVNSWIWNSRWTFQDKKITKKKIGAFLLVNLIALGAQLLILYVCIDMLSIDRLIAKIIATPFSLVINFLGNRLFVFKHTDEK